MNDNKLLTLIHWSFDPISELRHTPNQIPGPKPEGLWLSDESQIESWSNFCLTELNDPKRLTYCYQVVVDTSQILYLSSQEELLSFTNKFFVPDNFPQFGEKTYFYHLDWPQIAKLYNGILITPYICSTRLTPTTFWYYGWDVACGCIWNIDSVVSLTMLQKKKFDY